MSNILVGNVDSPDFFSLVNENNKIIWEHYIKWESKTQKHHTNRGRLMGLISGL